MVAWQNGQVVSLPLEEVLLRSPISVNPNSELVQTARALGIYVGELPSEVALSNSKGTLADSFMVHS